MSRQSRTASLGAAVIPPGKPPVPSAAALFGMISENTAETHAQSWAADVATLGRTPAYQSFYYHTDTAFPVADTTASTPAAPYLMITWYGWPDSEVNAGTHDTVITARALALKAIGRPVLLRWDIEMNITSYGYEPGGGAASGGPTFIQAWQRVWGLFQAAGASNVAFVWCPNCNSPFDPDSWRPFYPGDAYVDWIGVDGYNWGNSNLPAGSSSWETAFQTFGAFVTDWKAGFGGAGGSGKPLLIGETGCYDGGGSKSWWYTDLSGYLRQNGIKGLTLFNSNQSGSGVNWRWDSDSAATQAATELASDPYFGGSGSKGSGYAAAVAGLSPYAYWKLGETSGAVADSSGNGLNGTIAGTASTRGCVLKWPGAGYGYSMYGSGYADLGAAGTFGAAMSAGFTIVFCYKDGNNGAGPATILGLLNTGSTTALQVNANGSAKSGIAAAGTTGFYLRNEAGAVHYADITASIYDGLWHHVAWVCNPGGADAIYVDGASVSLLDSASPAAGTTANFGFDLFAGARSNRGSADQLCTGVISGLSLFKSKLTSGNITTLYTALTT